MCLYYLYPLQTTHSMHTNGFNMLLLWPMYSSPCLFHIIYSPNAIKKTTRNAWQSLAYSPLGAAASPLASSREPKPCFHLANVQRMHVVSVCLYNGKIIWVAIETSLDKLENKVQVHHLHVKRFHMVKRL